MEIDKEGSEGLIQNQEEEGEVIVVASTNSNAIINIKDEEPKNGKSFIAPYVDLFRNNKGFKYLWLAGVISAFGDSLNLLSSLAILRSSAHISGFGISLFQLCRLLPFVVLSPITGIVVDRFDKRKILITADVVRIFIVLIFLLPTYFESLVWVIYPVSLLQFSLTCFFEPCVTALIPAYVPKKDLIYAESLASLTWSTILTIASGVGGVATAAFGYTFCYVLDSLSYVGSAVLISQLIIQNFPFVQTEDQQKSNTVEKQSIEQEQTSTRKQERIQDKEQEVVRDIEQKIELQEAELYEEPPNDKSRLELIISKISRILGYLIKDIQALKQYFYENPYIFVLIFAKGSGSLLWGAVDIINIEFSAEFTVFDLSVSFSLGMLLITIGLGTGLAPFLTTYFKVAETTKAKVYTVYVGIVINIIGTITVTALSFNFALWIILNVQRTLGGGLVWTYSSVILQTIVREDIRGRVFALELAVVVTADVIAALSTGILWDRGWRGREFTFLYGFIGIVLIILWTTFIIYGVPKMFSTTQDDDNDNDNNNTQQIQQQNQNDSKSQKNSEEESALEPFALELKD